MRDKLIELLEKKYDHYCDQCGVNKQSHYIENLADYLIANGVTFAADVTDTNVGKWIAVSERLPNDGEDVLLYDKDFAFADIGTYYKRSPRTSRNPKPCFVVVGSRHPIDDYTHWMPIEPPKEGE